MVYFIGQQELECCEPTEYQIVDIEHLNNWLANRDIIAVDTETEGFDPHTKDILTIQFGDHEDQYVVDRKHVSPTVFKEVFEDRSKLFLFHNAKFDLRFLLRYGIKVYNVYDTFLAECVLHTGYERTEIGLSLESVALKYCDAKLDKTIRGDIHREGLTTRVIKYAADDVKYLHDIRSKQLAEIKKLSLTNVLDLENKAVRVFARMEYHGVKINAEKWYQVAEQVEIHEAKLVEELDTIVEQEPRLSKFVPKYIQGNLFGFESRRLNINWSSPQQKLDIIKTLKFEASSVDDRTLQKLKRRHPLISKLIEYSKSAKLSSAFGKAFLKFVNKATRRVHPDIWQILSTGRVAVSSPNLNQIPAKGDVAKTIRSCFIPEQGYKIVGGDYSGMELRLLAEFSQDKLWLDTFNEGKDLHSILCASTFGIPIEDVKKESNVKPGVSYRDIQKNLNFGLAYGMGPFKLADTLEISVDQAEVIIKKFFAGVPDVEQTLKSFAYLGRTRGYIKSAPPISRTRFFPKWKQFIENPHDSESKKGMGAIERASMNTPLQATNGDIIKLALVNIQEFIDSNNLDIRIILAVYDEIRTECPEAISEWWKKELERMMIEAAQTVIKSIPVVVDVSITDCWEK